MNSMNRASNQVAPLTSPKGTLTCALFGDHPGWKVDGAGIAQRLFRTNSTTTWRVTYAPGSSLCTVRLSGEGKPPTEDIFDPKTLAATNELTKALATSGPYVRVRNTDLWDALATGLIRQVIRAGQAKKLYRRLCAEHGQRVDTTSNPLFPTPDTVLGLPDQEFARLGLSFKRTALRTAAKAILYHQEEWHHLPANELFTSLRTIPRVGPWTAAAVVADLTDDFSLYPFGDLAVRTWARHLAPGMTWPDNEQAFAAYWRDLAGDQLSCITALTLAQGGIS